MPKEEKSAEIHQPDFEKMKRIFTRDLRPSEEKAAKIRGDQSTAWKAIENDCHCNKRAAKLLLKLHGQSDEERDDFLRTLYGGMQALGIALTRDLVDQAEGVEAPQMPMADGRRVTEGLATVQ
jgi:hypothetical protein